MEAPKCRTCGERHWSRICTDATPSVAKPATKPVAATPSVAPSLVAPSKLVVLQIENEALRAEVVMLKRQLSEANGVKAMTATERSRKLRERRKQT